DVSDLADELHQAFVTPFHLNEQEVFTSFSIGITLSQSGQDYKPENLLRDAHTAMYRAKDLGKARHEVFSAGMHIQVVEQLWLENDLRRAIMKTEAVEETQELFLQYQPIIALKSGEIAGFEALVRWNHPQHGFIPPVKFIPVAEEDGLIVPLGQWILQEACRQLHDWQTMFSRTSLLAISVNLSGQQFTQPDLVEFIEQTLKTTGLNGQSLKLEITETIAMQNVEAAIDILLRLRALDLRLSIDDFGTGYSSLSYLHRFPVNTLKVDRSFVSRMLDSDEDAAIVETIIVLGHKLGMDVVAEGIETAEQATELKSLGCEYGQGYLFSKPLGSKAAAELLGSPDMATIQVAS
ncbi:MAG: bifunctional diguanylate cyclase/phosphodiesterase, partial [Kovacikia sp.]